MNTFWQGYCPYVYQLKSIGIKLSSESQLVKELTLVFLIANQLHDSAHNKDDKCQVFKWWQIVSGIYTVQFTLVSANDKIWDSVSTP